MALRTIDHFYRTYAEAVQVVADLTAEGVPAADINLIESESDPRLPAEVAAGRGAEPGRHRCDAGRGARRRHRRAGRRRRHHHPRCRRIAAGADRLGAAHGELRRGRRAGGGAGRRGDPGGRDQPQGARDRRGADARRAPGGGAGGRGVRRPGGGADGPAARRRAVAGAAASTWSTSPTPVRPRSRPPNCARRNAPCNTRASSMSSYPAEYAAWMADPETAWLRAAAQIEWTRAPARAFDAGSGPFGRWFPDGELNTAFNCLDRHVLAGHGERLGADLGQRHGGPRAAVHLRGAAGPGGAGGGRAGGAGRGAGRPRGDLHADGAGGGGRHAGLRAAGGGAFRGVRRLRGARAGQADRGCAAGRHRHRVLRAGAGAGGGLHAAAGGGAGVEPAPAARLPGAAAPGAGGGAGAGPRPRFRGGGGGGHPASAGAGGRDRPAICALHLRHDGQAEGPGARQWRPRGGAGPFGGDDLRPAAR